jgi:branched-chain amino acid transport system permease protein
MSFIIPTLQLAGLYSLIALAWVAIFQATGIFNLAVGSFCLLGAYFVFQLINLNLLPTALAIPVGLLISAGVSALSYVIALKPLAGRPILSPIIVTLGLSIVIDSLIKIYFGSESRTITDPNALGAIPLGEGKSFPIVNVLCIASSFLFVITIFVVTRYTRLGALMRASSENPLRAQQIGINIHKMAALGWGIAGFSAALAGLTYAITNIASTELPVLGFKGLAPVILGGFQSQGGAIIGAILIALFETGAVRIWGGGVREVVPFVALLLILMIRPQGLFGKPTYLRV